MTSGLMNLTSEVLNELEATNLRVKNGSLTLSHKVSNETLLDMESLFDKRRELGLSIDQNSTGADYAAIGAKAGIAGAAIGAFGAIAQFIISIINLCDSKKIKIELDNGCYYRIDNQHHWQTNDNLGGENALADVFNNNFERNCPDVATCMYVREGRST